MTIHVNTDYSLIPPYAVMIVLSCALGIVMQHIINVKRGVDKKIAGFVTLLSPFMCLLFALLLTYAASGGKSYGLSSIGGLAGMYGSVIILALITQDRKASRIMFEDCTLVLPLMYSISKIGCFTAGCCHGRPYSGIFCVEYTGKVTETGTIFPVQLAETVVFFIIFAVGAVMFRKGVKNAIFIIFISSAAAKGLLDYTRESHVGKVMTLNQALCFGMILLVIAAMLLKKKMPSFLTVKEKN